MAVHAHIFVKSPTCGYVINNNVSYTIIATGSCGSFTVTTPVIITAAPSATISYATPVCVGTGSINVTHTGTTDGTYSSATGLSINATTGAINIAASTPGNYTVLAAVLMAPVVGLILSPGMALNIPPVVPVCVTLTVPALAQ